MLTLSLERDAWEPGNDYASEGNRRINRSHPLPGNDCARERFKPAPALDLIVPTPVIVPGREPGNLGTINACDPSGVAR